MCLFLILLNVLFLQLPHPLYLVQVHHEALIIRMELFDALPAEYRQMVAAIEMLHPFLMVLAQLLLQCIFILFVKVEIGL